MDLNKVFDVIDGHDGNGRTGEFWRTDCPDMSRHSGISGFLFGMAVVAQQLGADH